MKKTRHSRTTLQPITTTLRELTADQLEHVAGGLYPTQKPPPPKPTWTYTWPTDPDGLIDLD
jgi:hypothetical protein